MPVLNEQEHLAEAVQAVLAQEYAGEQEIVLALGPSTDESTLIAQQLAAADPQVRLVHNPDRDIPIGLNLAISASHQPIVIRVDAHSELSPNYTQLAVATLIANDADSVGGIMNAQGRNPTQQAIARAYNSPFGLGGGTYHGEGEAGPAESAYLGVFERSALERVQGFDPNIRRGEDWELNLRIRQSGGKVMFDPNLSVTYWPRASFRALALQFYATGAWRAVLVRKYPRHNPWRFYVPGLLVLSLVVSIILGVLQLFQLVPAELWWLSALHLSPILYLIAIGVGTVLMPNRQSFSEKVLSAAALITMHLAWGSGFLIGITRGARRVVDRSRAI